MIQILKRFKLAIIISLSVGSAFLIGFTLFGYLMISNQQRCIKEFMARDDKEVIEAVKRYYGHDDIVHDGYLYNHIEGYVYVTIMRCELRYENIIHRRSTSKDE